MHISNVFRSARCSDCRLASNRATVRIILVDVSHIHNNSASFRALYTIITTRDSISLVCTLVLLIMAQQGDAETLRIRFVVTEPIKFRQEEFAISTLET